MGDPCETAEEAPPAPQNPKQEEREPWCPGRGRAAPRGHGSTWETHLPPDTAHPNRRRGASSASLASAPQDWKLPTPLPAGWATLSAKNGDTPPPSAPQFAQSLDLSGKLSTSVPIATPAHAWAGSSIKSRLPEPKPSCKGSPQPPEAPQFSPKNLRVSANWLGPRWTDPASPPGWDLVAWEPGEQRSLLYRKTLPRAPPLERGVLPSASGTQA